MLHQNKLWTTNLDFSLDYVMIWREQCNCDWVVDMSVLHCDIILFTISNFIHVFNHHLSYYHIIWAIHEHVFQNMNIVLAFDLTFFCFYDSSSYLPVWLENCTEFIVSTSKPSTYYSSDTHRTHVLHTDMHCSGKLTLTLVL